MESRPNIIIILADEMGYGDLNANNPVSKIPTPNLDRLAQNGMRFTDAHACSSMGWERFSILCESAKPEAIHPCDSVSMTTRRQSSGGKVR